MQKVEKKKQHIFNEKKNDKNKNCNLNNIIYNELMNNNN